MDSKHARLVVADTGPINYLILIGHIDILPALFETVILPGAVRAELTDPDTPQLVRTWIDNPPSWFEVRQSAGPDFTTGLGPGETAAISLALDLNADLLLIDERRGAKAARLQGIEVTGTLGVLSRASQRGLIDLADAFNRLKHTSFRYRQEIMDRFLHQSG